MNLSEQSSFCVIGQKPFVSKLLDHDRRVLPFKNLNILSISFFKLNLKEADWTAVSMVADPGTLTSWMALILIIDRLEFRRLGNLTSHLVPANLHGSDWANVPRLRSLRLVLHRLSILSCNPLELWGRHLLVCSKLLHRFRLKLNCLRLVLELRGEEFLLLFFDHLILFHNSLHLFFLLVIGHVPKFEMDSSNLLIT